MMKHLIAELLVKLADKENEAHLLTIRIQALEIVVTALLRQMPQQQLNTDIASAIGDVFFGPLVSQNDRELLHEQINKILYRPLP